MPKAAFGWSASGIAEHWVFRKVLINMKERKVQVRSGAKNT
jgi:hypothetical protein